MSAHLFNSPQSLPRPLLFAKPCARREGHDHHIGDNAVTDRRPPCLKMGVWSELPERQKWSVAMETLGQSPKGRVKEHFTRIGDLSRVLRKSGVFWVNKDERAGCMPES